MIEMPYFDWLLRYVEQAPNSDIVKALATRYTHWGYFEHPDQEHVSTADFLYAAERLTDRVIALARIQDGATVLDVGCGFGGTVARINERFSSVTVTGLNIDARQIERARTLVAARSGNRIEFIQGDACDMPLPDATFDSVLALECVSHFPSRRRLCCRPGGCSSRAAASRYATLYPMGRCCLS
jgi:cyclopropane fatty-acyl-phospholipid synthase-like methyltransferase